MPLPNPLPCPLCAALVLDDVALIRRHVHWHELLENTPSDLVDQFRQLTGPAWAPVDDDAPTQKFPPIKDTVFRRPPPPEVRELKGAELLRALAEELAGYDEQNDDPGTCGQVVQDVGGAWICNMPAFHKGVHNAGPKQ